MDGVGRTTDAIEFALRGAATRSEVIADNVANANTPRFLAKAVDFESALQEALDTGSTPPDEAAVVNGMGTPDANGNTVSLETEMVSMIKNNLVQDALVNAYNFKLAVIRSAIGR